MRVTPRLSRSLDPEGPLSSMMSDDADIAVEIDGTALGGTEVGRYAGLCHSNHR